jgi:hypothetical protein
MKNDTTPAPTVNTPSPAVETKPLTLKSGIKAGGLLLPAVQKFRAG